MSKEGTGLSRRAKYLIRFTTGIIIIAILAWFFVSAYRLERIEIKGLTRYTEDEFLDIISGKTARKNTLLFRFEQKKNGQKRIPYIEKYEVKPAGNKGISIRVYEKILVGCVNVMGQYMYFDKDGYVTETTSELLPGIPLIKGLEFDRIVLYEPLKIQKNELYDVILNITKLVKEYEIPAISITFDKKGEVQLETDCLSVELGKRSAYDLQIQKLADILPTLGERKLYIDLSGYNGGEQDIIAKPKEE